MAGAEPETVSDCTLALGAAIPGAEDADRRDGGDPVTAVLACPAVAAGEVSAAARGSAGGGTAAEAGFERGEGSPSPGTRGLVEPGADLPSTEAVVDAR